MPCWGEMGREMVMGHGISHLARVVVVCAVHLRLLSLIFVISMHFSIGERELDETL